MRHRRLYRFFAALGRNTPMSRSRSHSPDTIRRQRGPIFLTGSLLTHKQRVARARNTQRASFKAEDANLEYQDAIYKQSAQSFIQKNM